MRSPFSSEGEAFHFLLLTVAAFTAIVVASVLGGPWVGLPVWGVLTAAAALFYARRGRVRRRLKTAPAHVGAQDERRILVIVHDTLAGEAVNEIRRASAGYRARALVVCPAPVSSVRHWTSDVDGARAEAERRLDKSLTQLRAAGIEAQGEIGDEDPLRAIEDALRTFGADEIVISTGPEGAERGGVAGARERFALPITHVEAGAAQPAGQA